MPSAFRVANWVKNFENSKTKELKRLEWVPIPNKMDGAGYTELVDHPNGAAHLGAWVAILEIASKQDIRGDLPVASTGTAAALARISRLPLSLFEEVLPRLQLIGWLEILSQKNQQPDEIRQIPTDDPVFPPLKGKGKGNLKGNGIEGEPESAASPLENQESPKTLTVIRGDDAFERMYSRHPRKKDRGLAQTNLSESVAAGAEIAEIDRVHALYCEREWINGEDRFAPTLAQWLLDKGWRYEPKARDPPSITQNSKSELRRQQIINAPNPRLKQNVAQSPNIP